MYFTYRHYLLIKHLAKNDKALIFLFYPFISSGAAFGVVLMLFLVPGNAFGWLLPAGSLGAAVTLLIIMIAAGRGGFSPHRMLLAGMALSTAFTILRTGSSRGSRR